MLSAAVFPKMLTVKEGAEHPFDIYSLAALHWKTTGPLEHRKGAFLGGC